jgi:hypothetical protein
VVEELLHGCCMVWVRWISEGREVNLASLKRASPLLGCEDK